MSNSRAAIAASTVSLPNMPFPSGVICHGTAQRGELGLSAHLALSLRENGAGRRLLVYPSRFECALEGVDEPAASYHLENWESGLLSGALYGLRKAGRSPENTRLVVHKFECRLRSEDMDVLSQLAAQCVAALYGQGETATPLIGWELDFALESSSVVRTA